MTILGNNKCDAEQKWKKCKKSQKLILKLDIKLEQRLFDTSNQQAKRGYWRQSQLFRNGVKWPLRILEAHWSIGYSQEGEYSL